MRNFNALQLHPPVWAQLRNWWPVFKHQADTVATANHQSSDSHHLAWHRAYRQFAQQHPQWIARGFDDKLLLHFVHVPVLPTATTLALAWDRQFGLLAKPPVRCQQLADLSVAAACFLRCYHSERQQIEKTNS